MRKQVLSYLTLLIAFGIGIAATLQLGTRLHPGDGLAGQAISFAPAAAEPPPSVGRGAPAALLRQLHEPLSILLLQVIVVIATSRAVGLLFRRVGQPAVVGEMFAGILLGPSLLGALAPGVEAFMFPPASMGTLKLLSQIGVILFMFGVGIELDLRSLRSRAHAAVLVSHASILVPFFLGTAFSLLAFDSLASPRVGFEAFGLFMGISMSITAFPVLARILEERGLTRSHLGATAIACAAVDDVTAWCVLAMVISIVKADAAGAAWLTILLAAAFIVVMLLVVKPRAARLLRPASGNGPRSGTVVLGVLTFVLASAWTTEAIGIHALFGAFLAGVAMPEDSGLRAFLKERIESFGSLFLLPLFFVFTGLRTEIGLLDDRASWLLCAGIVGIAIAGKLGGSMLAARWTGMSWHESAGLGILMNTRGLMELIVLNIGYDLGILSPRVFTMMIVMALATTFMTGPLLSLLELAKRREAVGGGLLKQR